MKNKIFYFLTICISLVLVVGLTACVAEKNTVEMSRSPGVSTEHSNGEIAENSSRETHETLISETGYPDGEIQRQMLFYKGTLYVYNGDLIRYSLPDNHLILIGKVISENNHTVPQKDFHSSRIAEGKEIYAYEGGDYTPSQSDKNVLWVKEGSERYIGLVPSPDNP